MRLVNSIILYMCIYKAIAKLYYSKMVFKNSCAVYCKGAKVSFKMLLLKSVKFLNFTSGNDQLIINTMHSKEFKAEEDMYSYC